VTIGTDGLGLITYYDRTTGYLKAAHCNNAACTSAIETPLADADYLGFGSLQTSVTIGADGLGLISYYDVTNGALNVAHCDNTVCTSASVHAVDDPLGSVGWYSSITIGADGLGLISYLDVTVSGGVKVAHCDDSTCTSATKTLIDSGAFRYTSATVGADGLGLISYFDDTNFDLKVAHCDNAACTSATKTTLDSVGTVGTYSSVAIGADGLGLISYYDGTNGELRVAHCNDVACTGAFLSTLDVGGGSNTSATIGTDGLGLISYQYGAPNYDLRVAHCNNVLCAGASTSVVDPDPHVSDDTSITIGRDGLGLISHYDSTNDDLKVAHCSNTFCAPYLRRR
jgi:hypothetical protein